MSHASSRLGDADDGKDPSAGVVRNSLSVALWTAVSRVTGFGRVAVIAAVLGPTYLGNTYQGMNTLPNLAFGVLAGSLFVSLLGPPVVRVVDLGDRRAVERLAGGFLGVAIVAFALIAAIAMLAGPLILRLITAGVQDPAIAAAQARVGGHLVVLLMPQVVLYGIAGTGEAVQHAHGRFALAAAAPVVENLGVIVTLVSSAVVFGTGVPLDAVTSGHVQLLGLGSTAAVGCHAAVQWWGARRVGVRLVPRAGWREPEVRAVIRRAVPSLGYSSLNAGRFFGVLVVANRVPGGIVAFDLALNFFHLPVAVGARPIAVTLLPGLSRLSLTGKAQEFREEFIRGLSMALFLVVPAAVAYTALSYPLARAVSFGEMSSPEGVALIAVGLATLGLGVIGESTFVHATHASYARHDATAPFQGMALRTAITVVGMVVAFTAVERFWVLAVLGLSMTSADLVGASYLSRRVLRGTQRGRRRLSPAFMRAAGSSAFMVLPAWLVANSLPGLLPERWGDQVAIVAAGLVGALTFLAMQRLSRSPELAAFVSGFGGNGRATQPGGDN